MTFPICFSRHVLVRRGYRHVEPADPVAVPASVPSTEPPRNDH